MKKNKGITLVSLIITVVLLILLAGTTTYVVDRITKTMNVENVKTDLLLIQAQIKTIAEKNNFNSEENPLIGTLSSIDTAKYGVEAERDYYLLSQEDLKTMNLENVEYDNGYYVCYETEEVIYIKGVKNNNGDTLYTLTQIKENN